jgi:hypothetical protein
VNRERKYRAWDGISMYHSPALSEGAHHLASWLEAHSSFGVTGKESVFMDWAGLRDRKSNDIYESDVLRFVGGTCDVLPCGIYAHQHHKQGQLLIVRCLESGYTLSMLHHLEFDAPNLVGNVGNYDLWNHARSFEVIGNIYQNPELLTNPPLPKE